MTATAGGVALLAVAALGLLLALTAVGEVLRARVPPGRSVPGVDTFNARVQSWWAMAVLLGLALLLGHAGVVALFAFAAFAGLREFATYTAKAREDHGMLATAFFVVLPLQFLWVLIGAEGLFTVFVPVHVFLLLPLIAVLMGAPQRFLTRVAETQWALMVCVYCGSHVPALLTLDLRARDGGAAEGLVLLIPFLVLAVQGGEVAAAVAERRRGRRPIAPDLSPRTWEAAGLGVLAAAALGLLLSWLTPFGPWGAALMAGVAAAAGLGGTLVLAAIKRERGVRDWSHLIPGQGGLLDQAGGVLLAAPLFYHLAAWGWGQSP
jgi:phosphatidate cytidylyltransferase